MNPVIKKIIGILLIVIGLVALVTPFTPGATWLIFIGLQFIGVHILFWDKIKSFLKKKFYH